MTLVIRKPGILTTLQDLGRTGYRNVGINPGGVMDPIALRIINALLGNKDGESVLEMHYPAAEIEFEASVSFAIGGADLGAVLDGKPIANWRVLNAARGSVLQFQEKRTGSRTYLSVAGGFDVPEWLGSLSTNLSASAGGFNGRKLAEGDRLGFKAECSFYLAGSASSSLVPRYSRFPTVRIIPGAEHHLLTAKSELDFTHEGFSVTNNSDRMGFRLTGEPLYLIDQSELLSSAVTFGTLQLLPNGQLVLLMADHQTTGGYPRIGHVITRDIPLVGQLGPGDGVGFHIVSIEEAEALHQEFEQELNTMKMGRRLTVRHH